MNEKVDLILHPIRIRIIQSLIGDRKLTAQQIGQLLSDVPQATLYRHLNKLTKAGLITIVEERPIRGTIEKVYAFAVTEGNAATVDLQEIDRTEHMRYFMQFISSLISDFGRYLEQEEINYVKDGVGYRKLPFYLDDDEFSKFLTEFRSFMKPYVEMPAPGRRRRMLTTIFLPEPDLQGKDGETEKSNDTTK